VSRHIYLLSDQSVIPSRLAACGLICRLHGPPPGALGQIHQRVRNLYAPQFGHAAGRAYETSTLSDFRNCAPVCFSQSHAIIGASGARYAKHKAARSIGAYKRLNPGTIASKVLQIDLQRDLARVPQLGAPAALTPAMTALSQQLHDAGGGHPSKSEAKATPEISGLISVSDRLKLLECPGMALSEEATEAESHLTSILNKAMIHESTGHTLECGPGTAPPSGFGLAGYIDDRRHGHGRGTRGTGTVRQTGMANSATSSLTRSCASV